MILLMEKNPAPVGTSMVHIPEYTGFHTSQVVFSPDFWLPSTVVNRSTTLIRSQRAKREFSCFGEGSAASPKGRGRFLFFLVCGFAKMISSERRVHELVSMENKKQQTAFETG